MSICFGSYLFGQVCLDFYESRQAAENEGHSSGLEGTQGEALS
ncbi:MAG: hypothetical protein ACFB2W_26370 [Leptolyngbyaceae cyanobacterium]